jgi:hypothetical protein
MRLDASIWGAHGGRGGRCRGHHESMALWSQACHGLQSAIKTSSCRLLHSAQPPLMYLLLQNIVIQNIVFKYSI